MATSLPPKRQGEEGAWRWPCAFPPGLPEKGVGQQHTCGDSELDTQDEDQENKKANRKALHGAMSWPFTASSEVPLTPLDPFFTGLSRP